MKLSNKGYSLVEMFAVIFLTSLIIFPLITTLGNNFEINDREQARRSASAIAQGTLDGLNRLSFADIDSLVTSANTSGQYYIELNLDNCSILQSAEDQALCTQLFSSIWNNQSFTSSEFRVFLINYNLPSANITSLSNNAVIPIAVQEIISNYPSSSAANPDLYRVIAWIEYSNEPTLSLTLEGLISNE